MKLSEIDAILEKQKPQEEEPREEHAGKLESALVNFGNGILGWLGSTAQGAGMQLKDLQRSTRANNPNDNPNLYDGVFSNAGDILLNEGQYWSKLSDAVSQSDKYRYDAEKFGGRSVPDLVTDLDFWTNAGGAWTAIPSMAGSSYMPMVASMAIPGGALTKGAGALTSPVSSLLGKAGLSKMSQALASRGVAEGLGRAAGFAGVSAPMDALANTSEIIEPLREKGFSDEEIAAIQRAAIAYELPIDLATEFVTGGLMSGVPGRFAGKQFRNLTGRNIPKFIQRAVGSGAAAVAEPISEDVQETYQTITTDKFSGKPYGTLSNPLPEESEAGTQGFLGSLPMSVIESLMGLKPYGRLARMRYKGWRQGGKNANASEESGAPDSAAEAATSLLGERPWQEKYEEDEWDNPQGEDAIRGTNVLGEVGRFGNAYNMPTQGDDITEQVATLKAGWRETLPQIGGILKNRFGVNAVISSAGRSEEHNAEVGGAENSYHIVRENGGDAVDIVLPDNTPQETLDAIEAYFKSTGAFDEVLFHDVGSGNHLHLGGLHGGVTGQNMRTSPNSVDAFMSAIMGQESGGNYDARNADSGAAGAFQIMPDNWPAWAENAGLGADAPMTPENQNYVARQKMQEYYNQFGNWRDVAIAWYAGPEAVNWSEEAKNRPQDGYPSVNEYADSVLARMGETSVHDLSNSSIGRYAYDRYFQLGNEIKDGNTDNAGDFDYFGGIVGEIEETGTLSDETRQELEDRYGDDILKNVASKATNHIINQQTTTQETPRTFQTGPSQNQAPIQRKAIETPNLETLQAAQRYGFAGGMNQDLTKQPAVSRLFPTGPNDANNKAAQQQAQVVNNAVQAGQYNPDLTRNTVNDIVQQIAQQEAARQQAQAAPSQNLPALLPMLPPGQSQQQAQPTIQTPTGGQMAATTADAIEGQRQAAPVSFLQQPQPAGMQQIIQQIMERGNQNAQNQTGSAAPAPEVYQAGVNQNPNVEPQAGAPAGKADNQEKVKSAAQGEAQQTNRETRGETIAPKEKPAQNGSNEAREGNAENVASKATNEQGKSAQNQDRVSADEFEAQRERAIYQQAMRDISDDAQTRKAQGAALIELARIHNIPLDAKLENGLRHGYKKAIKEAQSLIRSAIMRQREDKIFKRAEDGIKRQIEQLKNGEIDAAEAKRNAQAYIDQFQADSGWVINGNLLNKLEDLAEPVGIKNRFGFGKNKKQEQTESEEEKQKTESVEAPAAETKPQEQEGSHFTIGDHVHTKTGEKIPMAKPKDRVDEVTFKRMREYAKENGGYYNRYAKAFFFKDFAEGRDTFVREIDELLNGQKEAREKSAPKTESPAENPTAAIIRDLKGRLDNAVQKFEQAEDKNTQFVETEQELADIAEEAYKAIGQGHNVGALNDLGNAADNKRREFENVVTGIKEQQKQSAPAKEAAKNDIASNEKEAYTQAYDLMQKAAEDLRDGKIDLEDAQFIARTAYNRYLDGAFVMDAKHRRALSQFKDSIDKMTSEGDNVKENENLSEKKKESETPVSNTSAEGESIFGSVEDADKAMFEALGISPDDAANEEVSFSNEFGDTTDEEIEALKKELSRELNKLSANPFFNPRVYSLGLQLGGKYIQKGYRTFKAWVDKMRGDLGEGIEPWAPAIWETLKTYPKGVKFDPKQAMAISRAIGARYERGTTDLDAIEKDITKGMSAANKKTFAPVIEASYNGIKKFFDGRGGAENADTYEGRAGDEGERSEGVETVSPRAERGQEGNAERVGAGEKADRGLEEAAPENGGGVSENGDTERIRSGVSGKTGRRANETAGRGVSAVGRELGSEPISDEVERGGRRAGRGQAGQVGGNVASNERADDGGKESGVRAADRGAVVNAENYHIDDPNALFGGTPKVRFSRNQKAIEVFQQLQAEKRNPTQEEKDAMAAFTGWGSFGQQLFQGTYENPQPQKGWEKESEWLRDYLGKEDWESAQESIINAHYTSPVVVKSMWDMIRRMGFKGGRILEPSMGIGNFFGMMPKDIEQKSALFGVEMDSVTGGMAKMLYPQAKIQISPYQKVNVADGTYDLIVGNVPFWETSPADRRYDKFKAPLHDYFFLKGIDELRSGGIMMAITSKGTMDKINRGIRMELARKAELVDAYRFPTGAFGEYAGTDVVTDVLIFKKREKPLTDVSKEEWLDTTRHDSGEYDYRNGRNYTYNVNNFFENHPEKVLGKMGFGRASGKAPGLNVEMDTKNFQQQLDKMAESVAKDVYEEKHYDKNLQYVSNNENDRMGTLQEKNGKLYVATGVDSAPIDAFNEWKLPDSIKKEETIKARLDELKDLVKLRKAYAKLEDAEKTDAKNLEKLRKELKAVYDEHIKKYCMDKNGKPIMVTEKVYDENGKKVDKERPKVLKDTAGLQLFKKANEPNYYDLCALQRKDGTPAKILTERVMRPAKKNISNPTVREALMLQRNKSMSLDVDEIAKLAKKSKEEVLKELKDFIYKTPNGDYQTKDQYLSGNVRRKLREAQTALANGDKDMEQNIEALQKVMPEDIPYYNITVGFGGTWIDIPYYQQFIAEIVGTNDLNKIKISRNQAGSWKVVFSDKTLNTTAGATTTYGTDKVKFDRLLTHALNHTKPMLTYKDEHRNTRVDEEGIQKAVEQMDKIRETFEDWVWKDEKRKINLAHSYNEALNNTATPSYDGSFLDMTGMMLTRGDKPFNLRQHQINAIYRGLVNGSGIYAHEVGTGKTYTMGGLAMEARRFGIAKKPLILAHNANSESVSNDIREMYPGAKVLYISGNSDNVKRDLMRVKMDDWDVVVMPHSKVEKLTLTEKTLEALSADLIAELEDDAYEAAKADGVDLDDFNINDEDDIKKIRSQSAKDLVKQRLKILENIRKNAFKASSEDAIPFEDLGIDMVIVDESHVFKKPPFSTKMNVKGLQKQTSDNAIQLYYLSQYVQGLNNGKGVHLFTGTPITNTVVEMYHNMKYVMPNEMKEAGVFGFDDWFNAFAQVTSNQEYSSVGDTENVDRLNAFVNLTELRRMVGQYMDIVFADDMPEFEPRKTASGKTLMDKGLTDKERDYLINGRDENAEGRPYMQTINEVIPINDAQKSILSMFQGYAKTWREAGKKTRKQIMMEQAPQAPIYVEGAVHKAAMDARMYNPNINVSGMESKETRVIKNIFDIYNSDKRTTQCVMMEQGKSDSSKQIPRDEFGYPIGGKDEKGKFKQVVVPTYNLLKGIKEGLIAAGIPSKEIAVVTGSTNPAKKAEIAEKVKYGEIRVVIGSTSTLGTGVNMQDNLKAIHHIDAPWMPGDLEQRNGRILRQGNKWNTVLEYRYITEKMDGRRWQVLSTKKKFIKMFMKADENLRVLDGDAVDVSDADGGSNDFEETLSKATGDPRFLRKANLEETVKKLERSYNSFVAGIADAKYKLSKLKDGGLDELKNNVRTLNSMQDKYAKYKASHTADSFEITIGGKKYVERKGVDEAIKNIFDKNDDKINREFKIGEFAGLNLYGFIQPNTGYVGGYTNRIRITDGEQTITGFDCSDTIGGITQKLANVGKAVEKEQDKLNMAESDIKTLEKQVKGTFPREDVLNAKRKELAALKKDLIDNPVPPPQWLVEGAPVMSDVIVDGKKGTVETYRVEGIKSFSTDDENNVKAEVDYSNPSFYVGVKLEGSDETKFYPWQDVQDAQGLPMITAPEGVKKPGPYAEQKKAEEKGGESAPETQEEGATPRISFSVDARIPHQAGSGTTQVAGTKSMYVKALHFLRLIKENIKSVLDYGAGLGLGTDEMRKTNKDLKIDSFEPDPARWKGETAPTYTDNTKIKGKYDAILNTNVLNVVEPEIRDAIVKNIASLLEKDGVALITTRGWKGDIALNKNYEAGTEPKSMWVNKTVDGKPIRVYQKGFDGNELLDYVSSLLGDGYDVRKMSGFGKSAVVVRKKGGAAKLSASGEMTEAERMRSEARELSRDEWTPKQKKIADFGEQMGVPVVFIDGDPRLHGYHENGVTYLNVNSEIPIHNVYWHESFHWMRNNNPELYSDLIGRMQELDIFSEEDIESYRESIGRPELTNEEAVEEMLADAMMDKKQREDIMQNVAKSDKNLIERFVAWLRETMKSFQAFMKNPDAGLTRAKIAAMNNELAKFLRRVEDGNGNRIFSVTPKGEIRKFSGSPLPAVAYSFAGEKSKTADTNALWKAFGMANSGKSAEEIYKATGWLRGKDGKWRYEIPDHLDKIDLSNVKKRGVSTLERVYDNPELYEAYPFLKKIRVVAAEMSEDDYGQALTRTIELNKDMLDDEETKKTLVHEVQHIIGKREDFATGGDPESVREVLGNKSEYSSVSDDDLYWRLAGEQESREVERRAENQQTYEQAKKELADAEKALAEAKRNGSAAEVKAAKERLEKAKFKEGMARRQAEKMPTPHGEDAIIVFDGQEIAYSVSRKAPPKVSYSYRAKKQSSAKNQSFLTTLRNKLANVVGDGTMRIRKEMKDALERAAGIAIRAGHIDSMTNVKTEGGVIRTRNAYDWETILPEAGKAIAKRLGLDPSDKMGDYIGRWILDGALNDTSQEAADFQKAMRKHPELQDKILDAHDIFQEWNDMDADKRIEASVQWTPRGTLERLLLGDTTIKDELAAAQKVWYDEWIEELGSLGRMEENIEKKTGKKISGQDSALRAFRLLRGATGKFMTMIEGKDTQAVEAIKRLFPNVDFEGFKTIRMILDDAGVRQDKEGMRQFMTYCIAKHSMSIHKRNEDLELEQLNLERKLKQAKTEEEKAALREQIVDIGRQIMQTPNTRKDAEATIAKFAKRFGKAQQDLVRFSRVTMDIMVDSGLVSEARRDEMAKAWPDYVPFFRVFDENEDVQFGDSLKHVSGSKRDLVNPLESIIKNTFEFVRRAEKNKAKLKIANLAKMSDVGEYIQLVDAAKPEDKTVLDYYEDGKKKFIQTDPTIVTAIRNMGLQSSTMFGRILRFPAQIARAAFTMANPSFAIRNVFRDSADAYLYSKYGYNPLKDFARGLMHAIKQDEMYWEWMSSGAAQASMISLDRDYTQSAINKITMSWKKDKWYRPMAYLDLLQIAGEYSEYATRIGAYERTKNEILKRDSTISAMGAITEAAFESRDLMDFSRGGKSSRAMNQLIIFSNASIQGWDKFFRTFDFRKDKKAAMAALARLAISAILPSIALFMLNYDKDWWRELPEWQKEKHWIMKVGNTILRIPKGQDPGIQFFSNLVEKGMGAMVNKDPAKFERILHPLRNTIPEWMPTTFMPFIEVGANYSFFTERNIVPQYQKKLPEKMQYGPHTSSFAKWLGEKIGVAPSHIDHIIAGYGGELAKGGFNLYDQFAGNQPLNTALEEQMLIRGLTIMPYKNPKSVQEYYEKLDEQEKLYNEYKMTRVRPDGFDPALYGRMKKVRTSLQKLSKMERALMNNPNVSLNERKERQEKIQARRVEIIKRVMGR